MTQKLVLVIIAIVAISSVYSCKLEDPADKYVGTYTSNFNSTELEKSETGIEVFTKLAADKLQSTDGNGEIAIWTVKGEELVLDKRMLKSGEMEMEFNASGIKEGNNIVTKGRGTLKIANESREFNFTLVFNKQESTNSTATVTSEIDPLKSANELFSKHIEQILLEKNKAGDGTSKMVFNGKNEHVVDIDGDNLNDVLIDYSLAPEMGNITEGGLLLYLNKKDKMEAVTRMEPPFQYEFKEISKGLLILTKLEYADEDPRCCPSIRTDKFFQFSDGKFVAK